MRSLEFAQIPAGIYRNGSSKKEVERCVKTWTPRLLDQSYTVEAFRDWILKEFPNQDVVTESFEISRYPVTNADYKRFVSETNAPPSESLKDNAPENHPAWGLSFTDAQWFCRWLSAKTENRIRLPYEMEWEIAARGPNDLEFPYGSFFDSQKANSFESGIGTTTAVDRYERYASGFGVVDLAGNVEEWVGDCYKPYPGGPFIDDDLVRALGSEYPILRGGSFARGGDLTRSARRHGPYPSPEFRFTGFRLVRVRVESQRPRWRGLNNDNSNQERSMPCIKQWKAAISEPQSNSYQRISKRRDLSPLSNLFSRAFKGGQNVMAENS